MTKNPVFIIIGLIALLVVGLLVFGPKEHAEGAVDCSKTFDMLITIEDAAHPELNEGFLNTKGAQVTIKPDPQTGSLRTPLYVDNGPRDDSDRLGFIEETTACSPVEDYTVQLDFADNFDCTIVGESTKHVSIESPTARFTVDDCESVAPTATPTKTATATATATTVPTNTAVPTSTPVATSTSVPTVQPIAPLAFVTCPDGSIHQAPYVCAIVIAPTLVPTGRITAPNTGDAGLLP